MTRGSKAALLLIACVAASAAARADESFRVDEGKGIILVTVRGPGAPVSDAALRKWIRNAAHAVALYYGRFPVPEARLVVETGGAGHVGGGFTRSSEPFVKIALGAQTVEKDLDEDWRLTHELVHVATPSLPRSASWFMEGVATYVEPIARARAGTLKADEVWMWLLKGLRQGLPGEGDRGLDRTHTWGRTYWGGAIFCVLADLEIRVKTKNEKSLDDALRGILEAGGDVRADWSLGKALEEGDRAVGAGTHVLVRLHAAQGETPVAVDLDALFRRLGVSWAGGRVVFDDAAPLAPVRRSITAPRAP